MSIRHRPRRRLAVAGCSSARRRRRPRPPTRNTRQMMADIRMLQEQIAAAAEPDRRARRDAERSIKAVNARLDEQADDDAQGVRRSEARRSTRWPATCASLREKVDDNNVRVGSLGAGSRRAAAVDLRSRARRGRPAPTIRARRAAAGAGRRRRSAAAGRRRRCRRRRVAAEAVRQRAAPTTRRPVRSRRSWASTPTSRRSRSRRHAPTTRSVTSATSYMQSGKNDKAVEAYDA